MLSSYQSEVMIPKEQHWQDNQQPVVETDKKPQKKKTDVVEGVPEIDEHAAAQSDSH